MASLVSARPGWVLGSSLVLALVVHGWGRWPRRASPLFWDAGGQFWLADLPGPLWLRRGQLGPWHVYLQLQGPVGRKNLYLYKDSLAPGAWSALRRRLLNSDPTG